jgi:hypothetical protein
MSSIVYKAGYKYQLKETYKVSIAIRPKVAINTAFITLSTRGQLVVKAGYAWDGPSGPTIDTLDFMRGSLVHDALYQLMRERHLDHELHRDAADRELQRLCVEDGMSQARAWVVYEAVKHFADPASDPANNRPPKRAP